MKDYKEVAESVFRKSDIIIEARQRRVNKIRRISFAASGMCAAAVIGVTVLKTNVIRHPVEDPHNRNNTSSIIYEYNATEPATDSPEATEPITKGSTAEPVTAAKTEAETTVSAATTRIKTVKPVTVPEKHPESAAPEQPEAEEPQTEAQSPVRQVETTAAPVTEPPAAEEPQHELGDMNWEYYGDHIVYRYGENREYEIVYDRCDTTAGSGSMDSKAAVVYAENAETGDPRGTKVTVYDMVHVSRKSAIAAQIGEDSSYYVYLNNGYRPSDIEHMIDELNLRGYLRVAGDCTAEGRHYTDVDRALVWYVFTSEAKLPNLDEEPSGDTAVEFNVSVPVFGKESCTVRVTTDGYIVTDIVTTGATFYIGEERVAEIIQCIGEKYTEE